MKKLVLGMVATALTASVAFGQAQTAKVSQTTTNSQVVVATQAVTALTKGMSTQMAGIVNGIVSTRVKSDLTAAMAANAKLSGEVVALTNKIKSSKSADEVKIASNLLKILSKAGVMPAVVNGQANLDAAQVTAAVAASSGKLDSAQVKAYAAVVPTLLRSQDLKTFKGEALTNLLATLDAIYDSLNGTSQRQLGDFLVDIKNALSKIKGSEAAGLQFAQNIANNCKTKSVSR